MPSPAVACGAGTAVIEHGHAAMSYWLFQMVFVGSTASIVSGTLAERVRLWPFFLFIVVLTTVIYPTIGAWTWGGGWLDTMGFQDFAGSTVVHSTGGWAALAGVLVIGATGAAVCTLGMKLLHRLGIDDEVGAIPAHMGAGVWGTLAVCIAAGGDPLVQLTGIIAIGIFVFGASLLAWQLIDMALGARISPRVEELGQDFAELGIEAFPEFRLVEED